MKFPSWIRKDPNCVVLPYLVFRNGADNVGLCEANDPVGGIARHQHIVRDHAVLGMVVHAEITAPPVAVFVRGTHEVGSFVDLLGSASVCYRTKKPSLITNSGSFMVVFLDPLLDR